MRRPMASVSANRLSIASSPSIDRFFWSASTSPARRE